MDTGQPKEHSSDHGADHPDDGVHDAAPQPDMAAHENGSDPSGDEADEKKANDLDVDAHVPRNSLIVTEPGKLIARGRAAGF